MKVKQLKTILSAIFILLFAASCCKEETNMGTVNITFAKKSTDLKVDIYTLENVTIPVYSKTPIYVNSISIPLSFGNYVVRPFDYSMGGCFTNVAFQLNPDKKTINIFYDEYRRVSIR